MSWMLFGMNQHCYCHGIKTIQMQTPYLFSMQPTGLNSLLRYDQVSRFVVSDCVTEPRISFLILSGFVCKGPQSSACLILWEKRVRVQLCTLKTETKRARTERLPDKTGTGSLPQSRRDQARAKIWGAELGKCERCGQIEHKKARAAACSHIRTECWSPDLKSNYEH